MLVLLLSGRYLLYDRMVFAVDEILYDAGQLLQSPSININTADGRLTIVHKLIGVIVIIDDFLSQILLFPFSESFHF